MNAEQIVEDTFTKVVNGIRILPYQIKSEITDLLKILIPLKPKRMMEIGTANGGTLYMWTQVCDPNATLICMDLPNPYGEIYGGGFSEKRRIAYNSFKQPNQILHLFEMDTHKPESLTAVKSVLQGEQLDVLFIDGDHSFEGVKKDFEMYSPLVKGGGLIIFHDVTTHPEKYQCKVSEFWQTLKPKYKTQELIGEPLLLPELEVYGGIGIITKPVIDRVHIIMMAHAIDDPIRKELFEKATFQLSLVKYPKTLWGDSTCSDWVYEVAEQNGFMIRKDSPLPEWEKCRYAYEHTNADYIAICHADDFWLKGKLEAQLKYIENAALVMTAFVVENKYVEKTKVQMWDPSMQIRIPNIPIGGSEYGIVDCMPSTWLLNKHFVPTIPDPFAETFGKDCAIVDVISSMGPVIALKTPYVIYNEHGENQWFDSTKERHIFAQDCIKETVKKYGAKLYYEDDIIPNPPSLQQNLCSVKFKHKEQIMLIGWFDHGKYGKSFAETLESQGHTVYRISTDDSKLANVYWLHDHVSPEVWEGKNYVAIQDLLQEFPDTTLILLVGDTRHKYDLKKVFVPTYLYQTEYGYPWYPINGRHCLIGLFYSYPTALNQLEILHGIELQFLQFKQFIPWGVDLHAYPNKGLFRSNQFGFQGALTWNNSPYPEDPTMKHFYDTRSLYLNILKEKGMGIIKDRDWSVETAHESLVDFYNKTSISVNIPGFELCNERQFFSLAMGCVLLQYWYPELGILGFGDKYNCLTFKDEKEFQEKIQWAMANPEKLEQIRHFGEVLARENTWQNRMLKMIPFMAKQQAYQTLRLTNLAKR